MGLPLCAGPSVAGVARGPGSGVDPYRGKAAGQRATAFFRCYPSSAPLIAHFVTRWSDRWRSLWGSVCGRSAQLREEIADQYPQTYILDRQMLQLHDRRRIETTKPLTPAIEGAKRHPGRCTDLGDRDTGARVI